MKKTYYILLSLTLLCYSLSRAAVNPQLANAILAIAAPGDIHGPQFVCTNQSNVSYSTDPVAGTVSYDWTLPAGASFVSGQGTNTIVVNFGTTFGNICVSRFDGTSSLSASCLTVAPAPSRPAMPTTINGPTNTVCPGQVITYSVAADPLAQSYQWTIPSRMTLLSGGNSNTIQVRVDSGFVWGYLRASAVNCRGASGQYVIAIYSAPIMPGAVTGPAVGACANGTYHYSVAPVNGATSYTWYAPAGAIVTSAAASGNPLTTNIPEVDITFPAGFTEGRLYISSNSGCNSSDLRRLDIRSVPLKPGGIRGPFYGVCGLTGVQYHIDSVQGATSYTWTFSNPSQAVIHGNGNDTITVDYLPGFDHGTFCVTANDGCGNSIARCGVVWGGPQTPGEISGPSGACNSVASAATAYYSVTPVFGATTYNWIAPPGASIVAGQGTSQITINYMGANTGPVKVTAQNGCGTSQPRTLNVIVNPCRLAEDGTVATLTTQLYPNPATESVRINFESITESNCSLTLTDMTGRLIYSNEFVSMAGSNFKEIDLSQMSKGIYLVTLNHDGISDVQKLLKN